MSKFLTLRQKRILEVITNYITECDEAPTLAEIQDAVGIKTKRGVAKHLDALEKKGYIYRNGKTRGISLDTPINSGMYDIPILGYANAGQPLVYAEEEMVGSLKVDKEMLPDSKELFALIVKGDSMNKRLINNVSVADKNFVVIDKSSQFRDGDVVLAVIDNAATLKTFKRGSNSVILYPESSNPIHTPIYLREDSDAMINGKVVAVLENPS